jgi:hypothetical protein
VACKEGAAGLVRWTWTAALDGLLYIDGTMHQRLTVHCLPDLEPRLSLIEDAAVTAPAILPPIGVRLVLRDQSDVCRLRFDLYGYPPDLTVDDGSGRRFATGVLAVGRALAPNGRPAGNVTALVLLAREPAAPGADARFMHEPMSKRLRVRGVPPVSFKLLHALSSDEPPGFACVALRWD